MTLKVRLLVSLSPLLMLSTVAPAAAQECTGSPTGGFECNRADGTAAIGTVFSASESGGRRNVSLTLIEELVEEEAAPSGGGGGDPATGLELFASGSYGWKDYETKQALGSDSDSYGGMAGVSYRGESFLVGFAVDLNSTDSDIASDGGSNDSDEYGAQLFGTVFPLENLYISGGARIATTDIETRRTVEGPSNVARGDTDAMKYGLTGGIGYNLPVTDATVIGFSGWLTWERTETDGYTENGSSPVTGASSPTAPNLTFKDDDYSTLDGTLRVEVAHAFRLDGAVIVPSASFDYVHEFQSDTRTIDAFLPQGAGGDQTVVAYRTNDADKDYFRLGASMTVAFDQGTSISAGYNGDLGHAWREEHVVFIGLSHRF